MALTADVVLDRRGGALTRNEFAYPVKAGEKVYRGSLIALNSSGAVVRLQTSGALVFLGVCDRNLDNSGSSAVSVDKVVGQKGTFALVVPSATVSNILAAVYATDDGTLTLSSNSGANMLVGTLAGIENGRTFVALLGG